MATHRARDVPREGAGARLLPGVARHPAQDPRGRRPARRRASRPTGSRTRRERRSTPTGEAAHRRRARARSSSRCRPKTPAEALKTFETVGRVPHGAGRGRAAGAQPGRRGLRRGRQPLRRRDDRLPLQAPARRASRWARSGCCATPTATAGSTQSHVFADGLLWAAGVAPWKGGVFVAAPPDIWYLKDTDGDHMADVRRKVFTGFGTQNEQGMLNNLTFGPRPQGLRLDRPATAATSARPTTRRARRRRSTARTSGSTR